MKWRIELYCLAAEYVLRCEKTTRVVYYDPECVGDTNARLEWRSQPSGPALLGVFKPVRDAEVKQVLGSWVPAEVWRDGEE